MPRFQTDDDFHDDPAVVRAGTAAMGLYYRCGIYVAEHLLDGLVPTEIASQYGTPEWVRRLTDVGLWEDRPGGHYMPLYFAHRNRSREKVLAERQAKADRQQRWLEKHRNPSSTQRRVSRHVNSASNGTSGDAEKDAALPPSLTGRKGAHARAPRGASVRPPPLPPGEHEHPYIPTVNGRCHACDFPESNRRHQPEEP